MHIGTLFYTWLRGKLVGTDSFGNRYYTAPKSSLHGQQRRWVLYRGLSEASKVPPEWHAWLHHTTDKPLTERAAQPRLWQKPHRLNLTGTTGATFPRGHARSGGQRQHTGGDYSAWRPE